MNHNEFERVSTYINRLVAPIALSALTVIAGWSLQEIVYIERTISARRVSSSSVKLNMARQRYPRGAGR